MNSKPASFFQRHRLLTAAAIIVALMIPGCIAVWLATRASDPQNLGPQLQYIGKANYGNLPFSDAQPYSEYYYATDMSIDDMKTYFPNAVFMGTPDGGSVSANYKSIGLQFRPNNTDSTFFLQYYDNTQNIIDLFGLKQTGKAHVISITDSGYQLALQSL